jgi:hypothetical protein
VTAAAAAAGVAIAVHWSAALVVVAGTAIAFVELAYTLNREDDPSLAQVLGYIVGVRRHLDAVQEVTSQLAEVIEMDSWRPRSRPRIGGGMDGTVGPVAATDAPESLATKTTVAEEKTDVVLALPEDHPR